jgi:hypothetical protein
MMLYDLFLRHFSTTEISIEGHLAGTDWTTVCILHRFDHNRLRVRRGRKRSYEHDLESPQSFLGRDDDRNCVRPFVYVGL